MSVVVRMTSVDENIIKFVQGKDIWSCGIEVLELKGRERNRVGQLESISNLDIEFKTFG